MKRQSAFITAITFFALSACNPTTTTTTTPNSDTMHLNAGDSSMTKTTTTTTTQVTVHQIPNFDRRTFYNVKTHKIVKLKIDTVNHYYMDMSSNSKPDYFYYDPIAHDTFDYQGRVVNNALILNNGDYSLDESRLSSSTQDMGNNMDTSMHSDHMNNGNSKIKQKDDKYKEKTDNSKVKVTDKMVKVKEK